MRKYHQIISVIFILIESSACEQILEVKYPERKAMITLNCILTSGDSILMEVKSSQSYPPQSDSTLFIKNASIALYEDQKLIGELKYREADPGIYPLKKKFQYFNYYLTDRIMAESGHSYSVNVSAPGFTDISANTYIPFPVPIISVDTSSVVINYSNSQLKSLECLINFQDPEGKNSYMLSVDRIGRYKMTYYENNVLISKTNTVRYFIPFFCEDPDVVYFRISPGSPGTIPLEKDEKDSWMSEVFITDDSFKNKVYSLRILIPYMLLNDNAYPQNPGEKFTMRKLNIRLYSINDEFYKYARSWYTQVYKKNDMFSEPVGVYNNINNGAGIFSGKSVSVDSSVVVRIYYNPSLK
jgi:hypothetical protein